MATCPTCGTEEVAGQKVCATCGSPTTVYANPAPLPSFPSSAIGPADYILAGFWIRFLGFVIDNIVLFAIVQLPLRSVHADFTSSLVIVTVTTFLYGSLLIGFNHGQTLGMRVVSVRCVDSDGITEIEYRRAARRAVAYGALVLVGSIYHFQTYNHPTTVQLRLEAHHFLIVFLLSLPHLIDLLWIAWDQRNQTLHDKFAHTVVIRTKVPGLV